MNNDYRAVYKNVGTTPRTLHEAYRDGEYGYSIHLFKDDFSRARSFFVDACIGFLIVAVFGGAVAGAVYFIANK